MQPGDLVVCVNDQPTFIQGQWNQICDPKGRVKRGSIYTVAAVSYEPIYDAALVILEETKSLEEDGSFLQDRFRPVRPTSIEIFRAMLSPSPVREDA